jgi:hypothetical protein
MTNADTEALAAREDAQLREVIRAADARNEAESAAMRRDFQRFLDEEKALRARHQAEREELQVLSYRDTAVAQAVSSQAIAPQFASFINGTTREQVDAQLAQARESTQEILNEVAGARPQVDVPTEQPVVDRGLPAGLSAEQAANMTFQDWARVRGQFIGSGDAGLFS